jgi:hypothetical protein
MTERRKSEDDIDNYVLDEMFEFLKGRNAVDDLPEHKANCEEQEEEETSDGVQSRERRRGERRSDRHHTCLRVGWHSSFLVPWPQSHIVSTCFLWIRL